MMDDQNLQNNTNITIHNVDMSDVSNASINNVNIKGRRKKLCFCAICNINVIKSNWARHIKSKKYLKLETTIKVNNLIVNNHDMIRF